MQTSEMNYSASSWAEPLAGKYLTFKIGDEFYGFEILKVREIIGMIPVTLVPRMPEFVKGVINLRGRVIPVVNLRMNFGLEDVKPSKKTCIVVVEVKTSEDVIFPVGVIVDEVDEVADFSPYQLEKAPDYGENVRTDYIKAIGKTAGHVKILLNIDRIFSDGELTLLKVK